MRKLRFSPIAALLLCLPVLSNAQEARSAVDEQAVRQVVKLYLDGVVRNDAESLEQAIHLKGKWFFQSNTNGLKEVSQKQVHANIKGNARRGISGVRAVPRIVSIDVTNGVASVKAEIDYPDARLGSERTDVRVTTSGARQTDYLSLIRFNEGWKIVGKVSTMASIPAAQHSALAK